MRMRMYLCIVIMCLVSGCTFRETVVVGDPAFPQPWIGPGQRAKVDATFYQTGEMAPAVAYRAFWYDEDGRCWDIEELVEDLRQTLLAWGYKQPAENYSGQPPRERWKRPTEHAPDKQRTNVALGRPTVTVVCLDPVVALRTPGEVMVSPWLEFTGCDELGPDVGNKPARCERIWLPYGFTYGDTATYSRDTLWFSPTLTDGLQPVEFISDDEARIPVQWGYLRLIREGDRWVVYAEGY